MQHGKELDGWSLEWHPKATQRRKAKPATNLNRAEESQEAGKLDRHVKNLQER